MTGGPPGKELRTDKPYPYRESSGKVRRDTTCLSLSQNPSLWHPSWLTDACTTWKDPESEWLGRQNLETNPITLKPGTASHEAQLFPWVSYPTTSVRAPLPNQVSCLGSSCVSLDNSSPSVRRDPTLGPWKGSPPSCNIPSSGKECRGLFHSFVTAENIPPYKRTTLSFF